MLEDLLAYSRRRPVGGEDRSTGLLWVGLELFRREMEEAVGDGEVGSLRCLIFLIKLSASLPAFF